MRQRHGVFRNGQAASGGCRTLLLIMHFYTWRSGRSASSIAKIME
jgi:hypothetical protein